MLRPEFSPMNQDLNNSNYHGIQNAIYMQQGIQASLNNQHYLQDPYKQLLGSKLAPK
ncbi:uncharacterized protein SETTUDRAFT_29433 [Exserohilum turcica Et28A]|uniref:Uncharacterized protein n=1 Tax=Exserohilum turcicum (strain 28A) TaxID=671987 RepID=R0IZL2_EXST2|nr:uncharacterized protein SETTUDRAFT_29433 [Exserohilum turcica Et28A]EOA89986.1 hypothetical protein SETTUDRAFT_29433 [Exserohilum turcica Et28A]